MYTYIYYAVPIKVAKYFTKLEQIIILIPQPKNY